MTVKSIWKRVVAGATGIVAVFALAACSAQPGVAVSVNGKTYTEDDVSQAAEELSLLTGNATSAANVAYVLTLEGPLAELSEASGIEFSEEDARKALAPVEVMRGEPASDAAVATIRASQLFQLLQTTADPNLVSQQLAAAMSSQDLQINPRYGSIGEDNAVYAPVLAGVLVPDQQN